MYYPNPQVIHENNVDFQIGDHLMFLFMGFTYKCKMNQQALKLIVNPKP
jgi:hypothetical protein